MIKSRVWRNNPGITTTNFIFVRPEISPFFVGRTKKLGKLSEILRACGSAVIMKNGGAEKSRLMVALAAYAEHEIKAR